MTGCHPCLGVHQNRGVKTDVVFVLLHELFEPCALDVVFELHTERTVVPCIGKTAVYLGTGIYKASALAKGDNFVHYLIGVSHF